MGYPQPAPLEHISPVVSPQPVDVVVTVVSDMLTPQRVEHAERARGEQTEDAIDAENLSTILVATPVCLMVPDMRRTRMSASPSII